MPAANIMLSAVIDTSVFIRGLLASIPNRQVIQSLKDSQFNLIISIELFDELLDVIERKKFKKVLTPEITFELIELIRTQAKFVNPRHKVTACRDIKDQKILECALEGAGFIVSNDNDLLELKSFRNIPIIKPERFITLLK